MHNTCTIATTTILKEQGNKSAVNFQRIFLKKNVSVLLCVSVTSCEEWILTDTSRNLIYNIAEVEVGVVWDTSDPSLHPLELYFFFLCFFLTWCDELKARNFLVKLFCYV